MTAKPFCDGPFSILKGTSWIVGKDHHGEPCHVLDQRGWGYLTGKGQSALGLDNATASQMQADMQQWVVDAMNSAWNSRADLAQPDQTVEIDLRVAMMEELEKAASESPWVPKEYYMNEVISDCCAFLREDRTPQGDYFEGLEEGIKIGRGEPQPISKSADLHDPRDEVIARLVEALTKMRALMCEAIEDDDGNSGCGQCVNDCTGCIAHAALAAAKAVQK